MVRVVLKLQIDRGRDTGILENLLGLVGARLAFAVTVGFLQGVVVTGQTIRNEGVQRGVVPL